MGEGRAADAGAAIKGSARIDRALCIRTGSADAGKSASAGKHAPGCRSESWCKHARARSWAWLQCSPWPKSSRGFGGDICPQPKTGVTVRPSLRDSCRWQRDAPLPCQSPIALPRYWAFFGPVDMTVSKSQHHPLGRNLCSLGMAGEHHLHPPYRVSPFGSGQVHHLRYSSSDAVAPASEGSNLISRRSGASM